MIKKKRRGGARPGAGRKTVLTLRQRLWIGSLCDQFQGNMSERLALAKYEKRPGVQATRTAQKLVREKRLTSKDDIRSVFRMSYENLDSAALRRPAMGFVSIPLPRGKTRQHICNMVADQCLDAMRLMRVTPRRVEACWKEYRAFVERSRAESL